MQCEFHDGGQKYLAVLEQHDADETARVQHLAIEESHIIFLGTDTIPAQWMKIGVTIHGEIVALDINSSQVLAALGTQGWGKSHLPYRIAQQTPHGSLPSLTLFGCSAHLSAAPR